VALKVRIIRERGDVIHTSSPKIEIRQPRTIVKSTNDAFVSTFFLHLPLHPPRDPPQVIASASSKRLARNGAPKIHVRFPFPVKILGQ